MSDDDLGAALRQALAPPPLRPDPWAGQKLRERARLRDQVRRRRTSATASVVLVLALLGGFFALGAWPTGSNDEATGGGASDSRPADTAIPASGPALLGVPLSLALLTARADDGDATDPAFLVIDAIHGYALAGPTLRLILGQDDRVALASATGEYAGRSLVIRAGGAVVYGPRRIGAPLSGPLELPTGLQDGPAALLGTLRPEPVEGGARTGGGPFGRPLELYRVTAISGGPCVRPVAGRPTPVGVAYGSSCLRLAGTPALRVTGAEDVQLVPTAGDGAWAVRIRLDAAGRAGLRSIGAAAGQDWVFTVDRRPVGLLPNLPRADGAGLTLYFPREEEARLCLLRLRPE